MTWVFTAQFWQAPDSHVGTHIFSVRLKLSEEVAVRFKVLRDTAVTATGGTISSVKRVNGRSDLWTVNVEPSGSDDVRLSKNPSPSGSDGRRPVRLG